VNSIRRAATNSSTIHRQRKTGMQPPRIADHTRRKSIAFERDRHLGRRQNGNGCFLYAPLSWSTFEQAIQSPVRQSFYLTNVTPVITG
jgi:hypothetical protein